VRLLLGLIAPNTGSVRVLGRDPRDAETRTRIGAMLQGSPRAGDAAACANTSTCSAATIPIRCGSRVLRIGEARGHRGFSCSASFPAAEAAGAVRACAVRESPMLISWTSRRWAWILSRAAGLWDQVRALSAAG